MRYPESILSRAAVWLALLLIFNLPVFAQEFSSREELAREEAISRVLEETEAKFTVEQEWNTKEMGI